MLMTGIFFQLLLPYFNFKEKERRTPTVTSADIEVSQILDEVVWEIEKKMRQVTMIS
jgi:hypothetical protein